MEWSELHDMLSVGLMKTKKRTVQRAQIWEQIATNLCGYDHLTFSVAKRSVRDRYALIAGKYRKRMSNEEKASGISAEKQSELDSLLEDLIERENIAEEEINEYQRKVDKEKIKVTEVR